VERENYGWVALCFFGASLIAVGVTAGYASQRRRGGKL
jgi:hypothetical protein